MNILYIEDNPQDAQLANRYFDTTKYNLIVVNNLEDAYEVLSTHEIKIVLLDIVLNGQQLGFQFAADLREHGCNLPIVAVTALNSPVSIAACEEAGIDYMLSKPYSIVQLAEIVELFA